MLERLLTGTTWPKVSNISDEGGQRVGDISNWWDFLSGRGETPLLETVTPNIISPHFNDFMINHSFQDSQLWIRRQEWVWINYKVHVSTEYEFRSAAIFSWVRCYVGKRELQQSAKNTAIWSPSNYVLPARNKKKRKKSPVLESKEKIWRGKKTKPCSRTWLFHKLLQWAKFIFESSREVQRWMFKYKQSVWRWKLEEKHCLV